MCSQFRRTASPLRPAALFERMNHEGHTIHAGIDNETSIESASSGSCELPLAVLVS